MASIEILRGYSASGKSTYARQSGKFIVSRDLIRQQFPETLGMKTVMPHDVEKKITSLEQAQVLAAISQGLDVVIDDTNLVLKFARRWADLAVELGVEWLVRDFKPDIGLLDEWNERRADSVPTDVIKSQYQRFPYSQWQEVKPSPSKAPTPMFTRYVPDTSLPTAIGFDLDGTLAHMNGRSPYDESRYHEDTVDDNLRDLTHSLSGFQTFGGWSGNRIIVFSGRSDKYRDVCEAWLRKNNVNFDLLVMRKEGDNRRDDIVKSELFDEFIAPNYNFLYHFDDRDRVVKGLRSKGITVYQVAEGAF